MATTQERETPADARQTRTKLGLIKDVVLVVASVGVLTAVAAGAYWEQSAAKGPGRAPAEPSVKTTPTIRTAAVHPPGLSAAGAQVVHADIFFDASRTRLRADAVSILQQTGEILKGGGAWAVLLQGHADRQGPPEYNRALAQRRAEAVKQFLVELGVAPDSIRVVTIGQEGSLCDDPGPDCGQLNRRVHLEMRKLDLRPAAPARAGTRQADTVPPHQVFHPEPESR
jgi:outer membrane protein OmpA-like peptidoglycan-associated protein